MGRWVTAASTSDAVAGVVGGASGILAGHPLDTIRVRAAGPKPAHAIGSHRSSLVVFSVVCGRSACRRSSWIRSAAGRSTAACSNALTPLSALKAYVLAPPRSLQEQQADQRELLSGPILTQFRGLWRGLLPPLLSVGGQNALLFLGYGTAKRYLLSRSAHSDAALSLGGIYVAGAASGLACSVVTVPTEVIKCRLQVDSQQRGTPGYQALRGPWDCIRAIVRSRGLPGLFQVRCRCTQRNCADHRPHDMFGAGTISLAGLWCDIAAGCA